MNIKEKIFLKLSSRSQNYLNKQKIPKKFLKESSFLNSLDKTVLTSNSSNKTFVRQTLLMNHITHLYINNENKKNPIYNDFSWALINLDKLDGYNVWVDQESFFHSKKTIDIKNNFKFSFNSQIGLFNIANNEKNYVNFSIYTNKEKNWINVFFVYNIYFHIGLFN